ncbi:hypothetical protein GALMADRAFT_392711 [Galerina marginata CBS 339.88]|uniref:Uncharacterized protein n=1 Tax=Galerina marginata (strain CBS 339.88) TaxID=685588 RepID=A0A067TRR8_GALM3|nr:hypothetical protein GALMADRAFT_392711 [Galerina marginata CBS 339.88]
MWLHRDFIYDFIASLTLISFPLFSDNWSAGFPRCTCAYLKQRSLYIPLTNSFPDLINPGRSRRIPATRPAAIFTLSATRRIRPTPRRILPTPRSILPPSRTVPVSSRLLSSSRSILSTPRTVSSSRSISSSGAISAASRHPRCSRCSCNPGRSRRASHPSGRRSSWYAWAAATSCGPESALRCAARRAVSSRSRPIPTTRWRASAAWPVALRRIPNARRHTRIPRRARRTRAAGVLPAANGAAPPARSAILPRSCDPRPSSATRHTWRTESARVRSHARL